LTCHDDYILFTPFIKQKKINEKTKKKKTTAQQPKISSKRAVYGLCFILRLLVLWFAISVQCQGIDKLFCFNQTSKLVSGALFCLLAWPDDNPK